VLGLPIDIFTDIDISPGIVPEKKEIAPCAFASDH